ncbi:MAG: MFS transporter [Neisseriales bacterium]|nr:MAG: MFS transporter [Neisseriales bacterium]
MQNTPSTKDSVFIIGTIILVGLNLRPSMAAIGPLLGLIRTAIPMSFSTVALLTVLPVLAMGVAMTLGNKLTELVGAHTAVAIAVTLIAMADIGRLLATNSMVLILTAIIAGCGIAIIQAIIPGIIKKNFPQLISLFMGLYVTSIMGGAALAAALSPIVSITTSWQVALAMWSALAVIALIFWLAFKNKITPAQTVQQHKNNVTTTFFKNKRVWQLGIFFGLGTSFYTCVLAWLPPYYLDLGYADTNAGLMLAFVCAMEVLSGLILPALASRSLDRRPILFITLAAIILGFAGIILTPTKLPLLWASLLGIGIGGIFPLTLIVTMDHINDAAQSTKLTAFVQSIGYTIAAFSPLAAGYIRDISNGFTGAWLFMLIVTLFMIIMATRYNPKNYSLIFANK